MSDKAFVTGASGMLGANLCRRLIADGMEVTALTRTPLQHPLLSGLPIRQVIGDLSDTGVLCDAMKGCTFVFHAAGIISYHDRDRHNLYETNVVGTRNVLRAASLASVQRVIHTSSTAAIGIPSRRDPPLHEESCFHPRYRTIHYMSSKRDAEHIALSNTEVEVVAVNPGTIYGMGDVHMNTGMLFRQIRNVVPSWIPPGGTAVVSVQDCVEGHLLAMKRGQPGRKYILVSSNHSYAELWGEIARVMGCTSPKRTVPYTLFPFVYGAGYVHDRFLPKRLRHRVFSRHLLTIAFQKRYFDSSRARNELGWIPRQYLSQMLEEAATFYREHNLL